MGFFKKTTTKEAQKVQQEYAVACSEAGQIQYHIYALKEELEKKNALIKRLNQKYHALSEKMGTKLTSVPSVEDQKKMIKEALPQEKAAPVSQEAKETD